MGLPLTGGQAAVQVHAGGGLPPRAGGALPDEQGGVGRQSLGQLLLLGGHNCQA